MFRTRVQRHLGLALGVESRWLAHGCGDGSSHQCRVRRRRGDLRGRQDDRHCAGDDDKQTDSVH